MGFTRPVPTADLLTGTLIASTGPTVALVMPTQAAPRLRSRDRRRLAHHITDLERRLVAISEPFVARARTVRRLWALAERAGTSSARQGLALVAASGAGRHLVFDHPVTTRTLVGDDVTYQGLVEASWGVGRLGVLHVTERTARLVALDHGTTWEPQPPWDPIEPAVHGGSVHRAAMLATTALPSVATHDRRFSTGDPRHIDILCGLDDVGATVSAVLPASVDGPDELLIGSAQQALRRRLDAAQRKAMERVAVACDLGIARCGADAVDAPVDGADLLVTELGALNDARGASSTPVDARVRAEGGTVVVVPDGFLAHADHLVVAPRVVAPASAPSSGRAAVRAGHEVVLAGR